MRNTLHRSWKHSVAAVALFSIFGLSETVAAVINPNEPVTAIAEPSFQKEPASDKERTSKSDAAAIKEKLERIEHEIREQKEAGNLDRAEKLAAEGHELRAMLEKIAGSKKVRGKDGEKAESIDQLRERLRQLEAENEKLRHALEDRAAAYAESAKNHYAESVKKHLAEKLLREEEHAKLSEFLKRHADESHALREKLEYLGHLRAKAQDAGRHEEAEKAEKEIHKLTELLEAASKGKAHHEMVGDYARAHAGNQDLLAVMKEMRAEVSRLRDEVAELRKMVTERGEPTPPKKR